jgi:amino acid permease
MIVCIILVTPVVLFRKLVPLLEALEKSVDGVTFLQKLMQILNEHLATLINLLFNVAIIPTAVSFITTLDDNKTMARQEVRIMNRIFFFLIIIAIFLPLLG